MKKERLKTLLYNAIAYLEGKEGDLINNGIAHDELGLSIDEYAEIMGTNALTFNVYQSEDNGETWTLYEGGEKATSEYALMERYIYEMSYPTHDFWIEDEHIISDDYGNRFMFELVEQ